MCTPQDMLKDVGCKAFDAVVKEAIKHGKYLIDYAKNLKNLKDELRKLKSRKERIDQHVREAKHCGQVVYSDVLDWQEKEKTMTSEVWKNLLADGVSCDDPEQLAEQTEADGVSRDDPEQSLVGQSKSCFKCSCSNINRRYRLSKYAQHQIVDVQQLIKNGDILIGNEFAYSKGPPAELEFQSGENYVDFISRKELFKNIVLELQKPEVYVVGVYGLGGIGKSMLVEEVGKQMQQDKFFKQVALAVVSKNFDVMEVQSKLADRLDLKLDANLKEKGIATQLWNALDNGDKYLIILDDIWEELNIQSIGIPLKKGSTKGCKVLLTSRNRDLLVNRMNIVDKHFSIEELEEPEAWELFKNKVGDSVLSNDLQGLPRQVCEKCTRLPVAINAVGGALKDKPLHVWKNALANLERSKITNIEGIKPTVWTSLRLSYDMLWSLDAKTCFLLCCLLPGETSIDDLARHCLTRCLLSQNPRTLEEARDVVRTLVGSLKSVSLLLNGKDENVVRIHDLVRDVGISIGHNEKAFIVDHDAIRWPRNPFHGPKYSAISLKTEKIQGFPNKLTYPKLNTLMFVNSKSPDLQIPDKFFSGMKQLIVLILSGMCLQQLPSSLAKLARLGMLCLEDCKLEDIAILGDLKTSLEVLSLRGSTIEKLPQEIKELTHLLLLDLRDCTGLKVIPSGVISDLTSLEELYLPDTFDKWKATVEEQQGTSGEDNVSLEELRQSLSTGQLTTLHMHVPKVTLLPKEDLIFAKLKRFRISVGSRFDSSDRLISRARMLKVEGIEVRKEFNPLVDKAEVLVLKSTVYPFWLVNKLTVLIIEDWNSKYLFTPATARGLVHLEKLQVSQCNIMEGIVGFEEKNDKNEITSVVKFNELKQLELIDLPNLISFYVEKEMMGTMEAQPLFNEKVIFPVLERLKLHVENITKIWDKQSIGVWKEGETFSQLMYVNVNKCNKLMYIFPSNMHPLLKNLKELEVYNCATLRVIAEFEGEIDEDGPRNEVASPSLELMEKEEISNGIIEPPQLKAVKIKKLAKLKSLYKKTQRKEKDGINNDIIVFLQLKKLNVQGLPNLESFNIGTQGFFSHKVAFPVLERFNFKNLCKIKKIWDNQPLSKLEKAAGSFCKLTNIDVTDCVNLEYVLPFYMLPQLHNLQQLELWSFVRMEVIISNPNEKEATDIDSIRFPQLKYVQLANWLPYIKSSSNDRTQLSFSNKDAFPVLKEIGLRNSNTTKAIPIKDEFLEKMDLQIIEFFQGGKESMEGDSTTDSVFHFGIICDGCDVHPIVGPRFKSIVKDDYDLCSVCFLIIGVATDYVKRDRPSNCFKRLFDPERSANGEETDPNGEALNEDLDIPSEISLEHAIILWVLLKKIFRYGKQSKEECGTSGKVIDNCDEALNEYVELCMNVISMKRANVWWKMYLQIFGNGKQSKELLSFPLASDEECGTSGKESPDHNGEEFDEDLEIFRNKISIEDALTVLRKIYFENIQNIMESKECGISSKENDHNGEKLNEDLETHMNEISMEDALSVLGKIVENSYGKKLMEKYCTSDEESDQSGKES